MPETPICDIIVLVWNHLEYTKPCVESVLKNTKCKARLIIVDNDSNEETKQYLRGVKPTGNISVKLITNKQNLGFVGGNNTGLHASGAAFACILNNDTEVYEGWLSEMIKAAETSDDIGIVNPGSNTFGAYPRMKQEGIIETGNAIGFCMLIKRACLDKIGYLDDSLSGFFFEDTDYSYRAKAAGFSCVIARGAYVRHHEHKSVEKLKDRQEKFDQSKRRFFQKWGRPLRIIVISEGSEPACLKTVYSEALAIARAGNFVDLAVKSGAARKAINGISEGILHADLRILSFPAFAFRANCRWRILVRKKRYDLVITEEELAEGIDKDLLGAMRHVRNPSAMLKRGLKTRKEIIAYILSEGYVKQRRPITSYLPFHYHKIAPAWRMKIAKVLMRIGSLVEIKKNAFPDWPIDVTADILLSSPTDSFGDDKRRSRIQWPQDKKYAVCLTHDIDTKAGFNAAAKFLDLEYEFSIRSTWFTVLENCQGEERFLDQLYQTRNEIGAHGDNHDEILPFLKEGQIVKRLSRFKDLIDRYRIKGFRAPSLLRTPQLFKALPQVFEYDSSIPDTEISARHPRRSGCCSVFPYSLGGLTELPLTLPQDSTCLFLSKTADETLKLWLEKIKFIKSVGGVAVLNAHPDAHFGMQGGIFNAYRRLLEFLVKDKHAWITTAYQVVEHCKDQNLYKIAI